MGSPLVVLGLCDILALENAKDKRSFCLAVVAGSNGWCNSFSEWTLLAGSLATISPLGEPGGLRMAVMTVGLSPVM